MEDRDPQRVLIVDDNGSVRTITRRILEMIGYTVIGEGKNGLEAVNLVRSLKPDVIVMDIEMPKMDGITASRQIQAIHPTPVVLLTVHDTVDLIAKARDAGVGAYLMKPPEGRELRRAITLAIARFRDWMELRRLNEELQTRNVQLQRALQTIKTLSGLVPICAWCGRKIRDEVGTWVSLETYVEDHSEAQFTHGICPECLQRFEDEYDL
jgi:AmiR/NasT family two-component response regulator